MWFFRIHRKTVLKSLIQHFHKFVEVLEERDVDVSKVKISKAEAALWGCVLLISRQRQGLRYFDL